METAGFGGGCHWCTEGVFQILRGVCEVDQGFLQSTAPDDAWAEGVVVRFDPAIITLDILIEVHLRTHSANSGYSPNGRYRSAIYVGDADQRHRADTAITRLAQEIATATRTKVLPLIGFRSSEERYRNYYRTDPARLCPACPARGLRIAIGIPETVMAARGSEPHYSLPPPNFCRSKSKSPVRGRLRPSLDTANCCT